MDSPRAIGENGHMKTILLGIATLLVPVVVLAGCEEPEGFAGQNGNDGAAGKKWKAGGTITTGISLNDITIAPNDSRLATAWSP